MHYIACIMQTLFVCFHFVNTAVWWSENQTFDRSQTSCSIYMVLQATVRAVHSIEIEKKII